MLRARIVAGEGSRGTLFVAPQAAEASAPLAADSFFSDLDSSSEEDRNDTLEPEIAELMLYER